MIRKTVEGREFESQMIGELHFDKEPKEGSFNPVTSDGVKNAIDDSVDAAKAEMQEKIDEVTLDPSAVALGNVHLLDEATEFPADGCILIDSETNGPGEMSKDTLLTLTAQNALSGNVAPAFDPAKPNDAGGYAYYINQFVSYKGAIYKFIYNKTSGAWASAYVVSASLSDLLYIIDSVNSSYRITDGLDAHNLKNFVDDEEQIETPRRQARNSVPDKYKRPGTCLEYRLNGVCVREVYLGNYNNSRFLSDSTWFSILDKRLYKNPEAYNYSNCLYAADNYIKEIICSEMRQLSIDITITSGKTLDVAIYEYNEMTDTFSSVGGLSIAITSERVCSNSEYILVTPANSESPTIYLVVDTLRMQKEDLYSFRLSASNYNERKLRMANVTISNPTFSAKDVKGYLDSLHVVSDNKSVNRVISELYVADKDFNPTAILIYKCEVAGGKYRNQIFLRDSNGVVKYAVYDDGHYSLPDAQRFLTRFNTYGNQGIYADVNWDEVGVGQYIQDNDIVFNDIHDIEYSPDLASYFGLKNKDDLIIEPKEEYNDGESEEATINTSGTFPLPPCVNDEKSVEVYVDGLKKVYGVDYTINKNHAFVEFVGDNPEKLNYHFRTAFNKKSHEEKLNDLGVEDGTSIANPYIYKHYYKEFGTFGYNQYQWMEMVSDPTDSDNKVLAFVAKDNPSLSNARVQFAITDVANYYEIDMSVDIFLPSINGWDLLKNHSAFPFVFMTINEQWGPGDNNLDLNPAYRTSLNIKNAEDNNLYFHLNCQDWVKIDGNSVSRNYNRADGYDLSFDDSVEKKFPIPTDKWITLKIYTRAGYKGWYKIVASVDGVDTTIYDGPIMATCPSVLSAPFDNTPFGVKYSYMQPLKLYCANSLVQYLKSNNEELRILWKNLKYSTKNIV